MKFIRVDFTEFISLFFTDPNVSFFNFYIVKIIASQIVWSYMCELGKTLIGMLFVGQSAGS